MKHSIIAFSLFLSGAAAIAWGGAPTHDGEPVSPDEATGSRQRVQSGRGAERVVRSGVTRGSRRRHEDAGRHHLRTPPDTSVRRAGDGCLPGSKCGTWATCDYETNNPSVYQSVSPARRRDAVPLLRHRRPVQAGAQ